MNRLKTLAVALLLSCLALVPLSAQSTVGISENFDGITTGVPTGWDNSEGTTTIANYKWVSNQNGFSGRCLRFNSQNNTSGKTNFLKTPAVDLTSGSWQLRFKYKNPVGGAFNVYISTDGGATHTTNISGGALPNDSNWTERIILLDSFLTTNKSNVKIVFKGESNHATGDAYIYLDDVIIESIQNCTPQSLPFNENFDNMASLSSCYLTSRAQLSSTYSVTSGGKSVKLTTTASDGAYIIMPAVLGNSNALECIFQIRGGSYDVPFYAGVVTDTSDIISYFEPQYSGTIQGGKNAWEEIEFNTSACTSSASPAFVCIYINAGNSTDVYVDNIDIHTLPSCTRPSSVAVTSTGMNDVTFSWTPSGNETQWSFAYTIQQGGTTVASSHVTTTQPTYTVTGLSNSTAYTYSVSARALCNATDSSLARTGNGSFSTSCMIVSTFPYTENFESGTIPNTCQNKFNPFNDYYSNISDLVISTSMVHSGSYSVKATDGNDGNMPSLALPQMNFTDPNGYTVKFWAYRNNYSATSYLDEGFQVAVSPVNNTLSGATVLGFIPRQFTQAPAEAEAGWYEYSFDIPSSVTGLYYVIITYINKYGTFSYFDDVTVDVTAGCRSLHASTGNVTATSANIVADDANVTEWQIYYGNASSTNTVTVTGSASYTITGLTPNTQYGYYVRRICGVGDTSDWSTVQTFTTPLMTDTLPFITGFETSDNNDWSFTTGGYSAFCIGSDPNAVYSGSQALYVTSGNGTYGYNTNGNTQAYASKLFHFDGTDYNISFKYKCTGGETNIDNTTIYDFGRIFLVPGNTVLTGGSSWMTYGSFEGNWPTGMIPLDPETHPYICKETGDANGWNTMSVQINMSSKAGDYKFVVMWNNESGGDQYPLAIDDLAITPVSCGRPNVGITQITSTSATISASGAASYRVLVSTQPIDIYGTVSADVIDTVVNGPLNITDLDVSTTYYYTARGYCMNGDTSEWRNVQTFTTACLSTLPYTESFEQAGTIDCWYTMGNNPITISNTRAHAGIKSLYVNGSHAVSPELDVDSMSLYTLTGWIYATADDSLNIGVAVDPNDGSTFENIATVNLTANRWNEFSTRFTLLNDPDYSAFANARHFTLSTLNGSAFNADHIFFGFVPECARPVNPVITDTVHNGFKMTWTDTIASQWVVRITPTEGGNVQTIVADTQYVDVTILTEQTQYSVELATICDEGDTSLFVPCGVVNTPIYVPTCPDPAAAATVNATTASTMTVTANGTYDSYQFAYATSNSTSAFIGIVTSATDRVVLTGLMSNSTYYIWFRGVCEPGDTSRWSAAASGTTTYNDFFMPQNPHVVGVAEATSTTIAWGGCPGAHKYLYELVNTTTGSVMTDTALFTNLAAATNYTFRVCAVDTVKPDTTAWVSITFKTIATAATTPYFCDFETVAENDNWMFENGGETNHFIIGTATDFGTPTNALFVSDDDSTNTYSAVPSTVYAKRALNLAAGNYNFSYNWVCAGEPSVNPGLANDYARIFLAPASMQFEAGTIADGIGYGFTQLPAGCIALDSGYHLTQALSTRNMIGAFNLANAGLYNLVIFWTNDYSLQNDPSITVDSIRIAQIVDGPTFTDTICYNTPYTNHGFNVPANDLYVGMNNLMRLVVGTSGNPDTLYHADVYMRQQASFTIYDTICPGQNYTSYGYNLTQPQSGYYPQSGLISAAGCDSSTHLYLHVVPSTTVQNERVCKGDTFWWHGQGYTAAGTYQYTGLSARGCTVTDTLHLSLIDGDQTINQQICTGGQFLFRDTIITTAGTYTRHFFDNSVGCYVTHTLHLAVVASIREDYYDLACENHPYTGYGFNIPVVTSDTTITTLVASAQGCDSTTCLHLTYIPTVTSEFDDTIPASGVYYWGGRSLTTPGDYPLTLTSLVTKCDSVVTLHLHSKSQPTGVETVSDVRVEVIPNPVNAGSTAFVYGEFGDVVKVEILSNYGQLIDSFVPETYPIEVNGITASGIYYIRLVTKTGTVHVQKLIVR